MANNHMFNSLTGLGEDKCYLSQNEIQNKGAFDYNVYTQGTSMDSSVSLALSNGLNYTGGRNTVGIQATNIHDSNQLLLGSRATHPHDKLSLRERDYLTIPYLGRGEHEVDVENTLMHGETHVENKKSLFPVSEESYLEYSNTPLIEDIEEKITNPKYLVEGTHSGWIRGGLPSRELNRDNKSSE